MNGPKVQRKNTQFQMKDMEIVRNMKAIEAGMAQKRILTDDGEKQLTRLKQQRDKLYVDNQNKVYILLEKNRSVDLRHEMRMNSFEKDRTACKKTFEDNEGVFKRMRSRCNLTYLNIESNSVGRSAIAHLGKAVKHNPSLIQLRIGGNNYGNGKSFVKFSKLLGERVWKNVLGKFRLLWLIPTLEPPIL